METTEAVEEEQEIKDPKAAEEILASFPQKKRHLIPILDKIQQSYRYLPPNIMELVMQYLRISRAQLYGVISFYPQFRIVEPGKYILKLCYGTACFVKGAPIIADKIKEVYHIGAGETDAKKLFTLQLASCLGNCGAAPMAIIGDDTHGSIDPEVTQSLLGSYEDKE